MEIIIFWKKENTTELLSIVKNSVDELWLSDFIQLKEDHSEELKKELDIKKEPALVIAEEDIDFKDVIFEWITPSEDEIKSMLVSIIWWESEWGCAPWWCWSWCSC